MFASCLEPGDVVLDIGANVGHYTKKYAERVGPTGLVYAIEPHPGALSVLMDTCQVYPQVIPAQIAMADTCGVRRLYCADGDSQRSSLWVENLIPRDTPPDAQHVMVATLDAMLMVLGVTPKLIKVDAQGAEGAILKGAVETLAKPILWAMELWPMGLTHAGSSVAEVISMFESRGFIPCLADGRPLTTWAKVASDAAEITAEHGSIDIVCRPHE